VIPWRLVGFASFSQRSAHCSMKRSQLHGWPALWSGSTAAQCSMLRGSGQHCGNWAFGQCGAGEVFSASASGCHPAPLASGLVGPAVPVPHWPITHHYSNLSRHPHVLGGSVGVVTPDGPAYLAEVTGLREFFMRRA
jgi:hypothetical protein